MHSCVHHLIVQLAAKDKLNYFTARHLVSIDRDVHMIFRGAGAQSQKRAVCAHFIRP